jgi:Flp pilus assembly protein TadG
MSRFPIRFFRTCRARLTGDEQGVTMIIFGLILVGLLIIVAIVIDLGNARQEKRQLQNAADAAALAGASDISKTGGDPCGTAASYTYNNLSLGNPANKTCTTTTAGNITVTIATPYFSGPAAFTPTSLINVKACKDVPTTFARIIAVTSVHVCGNATARKVGVSNSPSGPPGGPDTDTPCTVDAFTADGYFDADSPTNSFPPKNTADAAHSGGAPSGPSGENKVMGATYWSTTDIDFTINKPTFYLQNTTTGGKTPYIYVADDNPNNFYIQKMTKVDNVNVPPGIFAYDVVWKVPGALANDSAYTVSMVVYDSASSSFPPDGKCGKTQWQFVKGHPPSSGSTPCGEDSFLGAIYPGAGGAVTPGAEVGATYQDESAIFNVLDSSDPAYGNRILFYLDGTLIPEDTLGTPATQGPNTVNQPNTAGTPTDKFTLTSPTQKMTTKEKFSTDILWKVPSNITNGTHTITLKAYDGDNNKTGGDCGVGTWSINVSGGGSTNTDVMLVQ